MPSKIIVFIAMSVTVVLFQNCGDSGPSSSIISDSQQEPYDYPDKEMIVKMKSDTNYDDMKAWTETMHMDMENEWGDLHMFHVSWEADVSVDDMMKNPDLNSFGEELEYAEPNYRLSTPVDLQNNPEASLLGGADVGSLSFSQSEVQNFDSSVRNSIVNQLTGVDQLQGTTIPGNEVVVAVLDSGLDIDHSYFQSSDSLWVNPGEIPDDGLDNDGNGLVDDVHGWNFIDNNSNLVDADGHGTHCAGIVLGVSNDIFAGAPSVSPIKIMGLRFLGPGGGRTSDGIRAIYYALEKEADILSNSWGGRGPSRSLQDAMATASNQGLLIVAAAGNDTSNNDSIPIFPSSVDAPNLISIAASTAQDTLASFSNFGISSVDLAAPGVRILSTYPRQGGENQFQFLSGTSMATPYVAGTAALMLNRNPDLKGFDLKRILKENADEVAAFTGLISTGRRVNSLAAVTAAETATSSGSQPQAPAGNAGSGGAAPEAAGGCGLVSLMKSKTSLKNNGRGSFSFLFLMLIPLLLVQFLIVKVQQNKLMNESQ